MQIAAAPFRDDAVLRLGHAYEKATAWRSQRPRLERGATSTPIRLQPEPAVQEPDATTLAFIQTAAQRAGLQLDARSREMLVSAAPYALAMADRIARNHARAVEPAMVFAFPK